MLLQLARALWGGLLLLAPQLPLRRVQPPSRGVVDVTRILGARHLVEVAILSARQHRRPPRWPVLVDLLHAASMIAIATCSRRVRRDALASAAVAGALAGWSELERRKS